MEEWRPNPEGVFMSDETKAALSELGSSIDYSLNLVVVNAVVALVNALDDIREQLQYINDNSE